MRLTPTATVRAMGFAVLLTACLSAQDFVGRWTGVADTTDEAGTKRQERQTLEIRSENGKLTGMMVNRSGNGGIPFQVQTDGAKVNLYGFLTLDGGEHLRWKFELQNGELVGTFSALHDNPAKWQFDRIGKMTVTKQPSGAVTPSTPTVIMIH